MNLPNAEKYIQESNRIKEVYATEDELSFRAWIWLSKQKEINEDVLLKLHRLIMIRQRPEIAGKFRTCNTTVGGRLCPKPEIALKQLETILVSANLKMSALYALDWHIDFEHTHPFKDGNGRTGRMLYRWMCLKNGFMPMLFIHERRDEYYSLFKRSVQATLKTEKTRDRRL